MYCVRCGRELQDRDTFCPGCGKAVNEPVPMMPQQGRIAGHVRLLGILWIAVSVFRLMPGLVVLSIFHHGFPFMRGDIPGFLLPIVRGAGLALLTGGVLGVIAGWGLLDRRPWARMLAIVLGCIGLIDMPFGTALGIYTLWVLLPAQSEAEYQRISKAA